MRNFQALFFKFSIFIFIPYLRAVLIKNDKIIIFQHHVPD